MASLTEDLARWLYNHNPDLSHEVDPRWPKVDHQKKEEYRLLATDLQNYMANIARMPGMIIPKDHIPVKSHFRRKPKRIPEPYDALTKEELSGEELPEGYNAQGERGGNQEQFDRYHDTAMRTALQRGDLP